MATLLLRLVGPMQSWGTTSRFAERDTGREPSKSGVVGLLAAALGIDRADWEGLRPLAELRLAVRHDRPGIFRKEYQTAGAHKDDRMMKADGSLSKDGMLSSRQYLADAAFWAGLEGARALLERADTALRDPVWPLFLGRKSYVPTEPIHAEGGVSDLPLLEALRQCPWLGQPGGKLTERLRISRESEDGSGVLRMDQPLSSFAERRFGARYIVSEWMDIAGEADHVVA